MELGGNAPVPGLRRRRPRRRGRGRDDREDAQHRRGLHLGEPLPRRTSRSPTSSPSKLAERMGALKVGRGTEEGVDVGPLIDEDQRGKVAELVDDAVDKGANCLTGGERARRRRLLLRADRARRRARRRAGAERGDLRPGRAGRRASRPSEEAIAAANDTEYGLVAYVFTRDLKRALRVCEALETGMIGLNQGMVSNAGRAVRRRQAVRHRPRGRQRGHPRVPRDQVRRDQHLNGAGILGICARPWSRGWVRG